MTKRNCSKTEVATDPIEVGSALAIVYIPYTPVSLSPTANTNQLRLVKSVPTGDNFNHSTVVRMLTADFSPAKSSP